MKSNYNCICCKKEIKKLDGYLVCSWDGGIVEEITAGYGSLFDGNTYVFAICDDCIKLVEPCI